MKKIVYLFMVLLLGLSIWSCEYDDDDLWKEVGEIKTQLTELNKEVSTLQGLVDALQKGKIISELKQTDTGYTLHFTDGTTLSIADGKDGMDGADGKDGMDGADGKDAPLVGIGLHEGVYYWTLGGADQWLTDADGNRIPVAGKDGHSPELTVDAEGFWSLDGVRVTDPEGQAVKAVGKDGKDGDSFFSSIEDGKNEVTVRLTDGTTIVLPKSNAGQFAFIRAKGDAAGFFFAAGQERTIGLSMDGISAADKMNVPDGWTVKVDAARKEVTVKAPDQVEPAGGIITLVGISEAGATVFASAEVSSVDYSDPQGTFLLCEGNMSSVNGMMVYYDRNGKEYTEVFEKANAGQEIGNVLQDMYMADGKIYLLTQNGDSQGGAGRFVVCDARTLKMQYADPLVITTPDGKPAWPQHIVVAGPTKAYVQYAESPMEATSGICTLNLEAGAVTVGPTIDGTFGAFTVAGATKARMVLSQDKVYAGGGQRLLVINALTGALEKTLDYPGQQVKGVVKAADGNIYLALTGKFSGSSYAPVFTSPAQIVGIDHGGNEISRTDMPEEIRLSVASFTPAVGMCASFTEPFLYFVDNDAFSCMTASRYNYQTGSFDVNYVQVPTTLYGIMGVHPVTGELWVPVSDYVSSEIYVFDVSGSSRKEVRHFKYSSQKGASPAGIDFAYRFTSEFIEK